MAAILVLYIFLLGIFVIMSVLIFRYIVKFSYLSPRFTSIVTVFGVIALFVILFTFYLLVQGFSGSDGSSANSTSSSASGELNF